MKKIILLFVVGIQLILIHNLFGVTYGEAIPNTRGPYLRHNQSRVFWYDGFWWGVFYRSTTSIWYVYKFDGNSWSTEVSLNLSGSQQTPDVRVDPFSKKLFILMPMAELIYRLSYSSGSWVMDSGFPRSVPGASSGARDNPSVLLQALDGDLLVFTLHDSALWVTYSQDNGVTWPGAATAIRSLTRSIGLVDATEFMSGGNGYVGVFVSENSKGNVFFIRLSDASNPTVSSNWTEETLPNKPESDDHVSIVRDFDNNLYAIMKWGSSGSSDPFFTLYHRDQSGSWHDYGVYNTDPGNTTRPALTINETTNELYVLATVSDKIGYAVLDKDNLQDVQTGDWITALENGSDVFNDVNVTYQQVSSGSGMMVTGYNATRDEVWYRYLPINFNPPDNLIINEVHSESNVLASYLELFNRGSSSLNLSNYSLNYYNNGSTSATSSKTLSGSIPANGFVVLARSSSAFQSVYGFAPDFSASGFMFDGGTDGISLTKSGSIVDYFNSATEDMMYWPANFLFDRGHYPNDGTNLPFDFYLRGSNQVGTPGGGATISATIRYITPDKSTYFPGEGMSITEEIDTDLSSQQILIVTSILDNLFNSLTSTSRTVTISGSSNDAFIESLTVPSGLSSGTYSLQVKVYDSATNNLQDLNTQNFEVGQGDTWFNKFTITGPTATFYRTISGHPLATDDFDTGLDSSLSAPASDFYAAFRIPTPPNYLKKDARYWDAPFDTPIDWTLKILNTGGSTVTVQWDSTAFPAEGIFLLDGLSFPVDMRQANTVSLNADVDLTVSYSQSVDFTFSFMQSGWYLISLPAEPADNSLSTLFPDALIAYTWDTALQQYVSVSQLETGVGYWLAILSPQSAVISGTPVSRLEKSLTMGWHQVGALFSSTDFANPLDTPDGSVVAAYRFNTTTGNYELVQSLDAQEGYWVAAVNNCDLLLKQALPTAAKSSPQNIKLTEDYIRQFGSTPPPPPTAMGIGPVGLKPMEFGLDQNYPNPFNPVTNVRFTLSSRERIELSVFNILGQKVATLASGVFNPGVHEIRWEGRDDNGAKLPSGVYFCKLAAGKKQLIHKMVLSK